MKKRLFMAMAALVTMTMSFAQEYMIFENVNGGIARFDVSVVKQGYFMTFEATGAGTADNPFNVAGANAKCKEIGTAPSTEQYYVKGYVISVSNKSLYIADDMGGINRIYTEASISASYELKKGDEVVVLGNLYNYNNLTPYVVSGQIISINGQTIELPKPQGAGTLEDPYNVQAIIDIINALAADTPLETPYYVKGIVTNVSDVSTVATYNNCTFNISDDKYGTNTLLLYRCKGLGGNDITDENFIKVGDEVVIYSTAWINYKGVTPETKQGASYIYSINGKTSDHDGSLAKPFDPAEANDFVSEMEAGVSTDKDYYIKGKIVKITNEFNTQYGNSTFYISDDGSNKEDQFFVYRTLYLGNVNYSDNSWLKPVPGDEVIICGKLINYKGTTPETLEKQSYIYSLNDKTTIDNGGGGTSNEDDVQVVTIAEFNAAQVSNDIWYQLTGTVKNLKDGDQYGNFDLEDNTGSVYVYGLLTEKGGAKKQFQQLVAEKGIKEGSNITIIGNRGEYGGKIEVKNAYFVSIQND